MSNDLNQCQFIGRLGKDPEVRYMPSGKAIATFSLAVGSSWKDNQGEKQESTEWVNVTAFDKLGEICGEYLEKGKQVFISGRLKTEKYEKDGQTRYITKVIAERMQMLGGRSDAEAPAAAPPPPVRRNAPGSAASMGSAGRPAPKPSTGFDDMDDDIPFASSSVELDTIHGHRKAQRARAAR